MGLWVAGHLSVETIRDQVQRVLAAGPVWDPAERGDAIH